MIAIGVIIAVVVGVYLLVNIVQAREAGRLGRAFGIIDDTREE